MWVFFAGCMFFFFKQKTAYEMRISDWSSDVCSSDLATALNAYARERDPFSRVGKATVAVEVTNVVRASPASFQVRWVERTTIESAEIGRASCRERVCQYV